MKSIAILTGLLLFCTSAWSKSIDHMVGQPAPKLENLQWIHLGPLSLEDLEGQVVLIRWWTAPYCPFCKASSVALNEWHEQYQQQGLTVLGLYHHKVSDEMNPEDVKRYANQLSFKFPIAVDPKWQNLQQWWLQGKRRFTSVSFLIDKQGTIRYIHPGGQYVKGDGDYEQLHTMIQQLLAEPHTHP